MDWKGPSKTQNVLMLVALDDRLEAFLTESFPEIRLERFRSGRSAADAFPTLAPSWIVSEYETEDWNGRSLFLAVHKDRPFTAHPAVPFILFSHDDKTRRLHGDELFALGLRGWYALPLDDRSLREIFENHFRTLGDPMRNLQLQQEVKKSEFRYRDLLENAADFIFTLDADGHFLYLNNRFNGLVHNGKDRWLGKPFLSIVDSADRPFAAEHYHIARQGKARVFEARILGQEPDRPVLSFSLTPIFEHGKIVGSIGIGRDMAEQKKMEQEILDLKNFNESIIESMEAGLLTMDPEARVTSINSAGQKILGWKAEEIFGKSIRSFLKPDEVDDLLSNPNKPGTPSNRREMQLILKSGKSVSIGFTVADRIDNQRKKVGTIISFRDITQLKQMQAEVIRMDRLASLGVLASGIAHEIKNPLAGIKALAQACEEEFDSDDSRREYLMRITRQVNRLDDLLRTFFSFARPKPPNRKHTAVEDILGDVLHLLDKKMQTHRIQYSQNLPKNLKPVWVDIQQMQQVFLNLFLNAIEAMPDGGTLQVATNRIQKTVSKSIRKNAGSKEWLDHPFVETIVQDTGTGIPPDKLDTIFDPFYTTKPNGLGLGLSIVYRIIEEHGGELHVESRVGIGTTFTIILPTGANP